MERQHWTPPPVFQHTAPGLGGEALSVERDFQIQCLSRGTLGKASQAPSLLTHTQRYRNLWPGSSEAKEANTRTSQQLTCQPEPGKRSRKGSWTLSVGQPGRWMLASPVATQLQGSGCCVAEGGPGLAAPAPQLAHHFHSGLGAPRPCRACSVCRTTSFHWSSEIWLAQGGMPRLGSFTPAIVLFTSSTCSASMGMELRLL